MKKTSLRVKIPPEMRKTLSQDVFMSKCALMAESCAGRLEWNHSFKYRGCRINELWSLIPLCHFHHDRESAHRQELDKIMLKRIKHFKADLKEYPRSPLLKLI